MGNYLLSVFSGKTQLIQKNTRSFLGKIALESWINCSRHKALTCEKSKRSVSNQIPYGLPIAGLVQKTAFPWGSGREFRVTGVSARKPVDEKPPSKEGGFSCGSLKLARLN
jgi:hypothetical protein